MADMTWPSDVRLSEPARQTLVAIARAVPEVQQLILFGSRATGMARPESDIDLAVSGPGLTPAAVASMWQAIDDSDLLYTVDLVHLHPQVDAALRAAIKREGVVLWSRSPPPSSCRT